MGTTLAGQAPCDDHLDKSSSSFCLRDLLEDTLEDSPEEDRELQRNDLTLQERLLRLDALEW